MCLSKLIPHGRSNYPVNRGGASAPALCAQGLRGKGYSLAYLYTPYVNLYELCKNVCKLFFPLLPESQKDKILRSTIMQKISLLFGEVKNPGKKCSVDSRMIKAARQNMPGIYER